MDCYSAHHVLFHSPHNVNIIALCNRMYISAPTIGSRANRKNELVTRNNLLAKVRSWRHRNRETSCASLLGPRPSSSTSRLSSQQNYLWRYVSSSTVQCLYCSSDVTFCFPCTDRKKSIRKTRFLVKIRWRRV